VVFNFNFRVLFDRDKLATSAPTIVVHFTGEEKASSHAIKV